MLPVSPFINWLHGCFFTILSRMHDELFTVNLRACGLLNGTFYWRTGMHIVGKYMVLTGLLAGLGIQAQELPPALRKAVENRFPGAVITETEAESYQGRQVTEVELKAADGKGYELLLSKEGEVLNVAEEGEGGLPWIGGTLSLGLGVGIEREVYRGVGTELNFNPFLLYENGPLQILTYDDIQASYAVWQGPMFDLDISGTLITGAGFEVDDSDYFEGMSEPGTLFMFGVQLQRNWQSWEWGLGLSQDLSGKTNGQEVDLSLAYIEVLGDVELRPELSVTWISEELVDYSYGVSAAEARPDRPAYTPGASIEVEARLLAIKPLRGNFSLLGLLSATWLGKDISDSPLVENDVELSAAVGVIYSF